MHVYTYTPNKIYIYLKLGLTILGWISTPKLPVFSAIFAHWAVKDSSIHMEKQMKPCKAWVALDHSPIIGLILKGLPSGE